MIEYKLVGPYPKKLDFVAVVNKFLQDGWSLQGGICVYGGNYHQAVVRESAEREPGGEYEAEEAEEVEEAT